MLRLDVGPELIWDLYLGTGPDLADYDLVVFRESLDRLPRLCGERLLSEVNDYVVLTPDRGTELRPVIARDGMQRALWSAEDFPHVAQTSSRCIAGWSRDE